MKREKKIPIGNSDHLFIFFLFGKDCHLKKKKKQIKDCIYYSNGNIFEYIKYNKW